jgi:diamine N-acetyltransferase
VAPIATWFADLYGTQRRDGRTHSPWLRAIRADGDIVGALLMCRPQTDERSCTVGRLMVDRMHQRRGIGARTLGLAIEQARSWAAHGVLIRWSDLPGGAGPLCLSYGFEPTGRTAEGEIEGRLDL